MSFDFIYKSLDDDFLGYMSFILKVENASYKVSVLYGIIKKYYEEIYEEVQFIINCYFNNFYGKY